MIPFANSCTHMQALVGRREAVIPVGYSLSWCLQRTQTCYYEQMSRIYAPDTRKVLTAAESLVLDDTPWLRPRIRYDLVRVAHPAIKDFARFIGVRRLSEAVEERVDRGSALSRVPAGAAPELEQWGGNVRTLAFRNGIKRILFDEGRSLQVHGGLGRI